MSKFTCASIYTWVWKSTEWNMGAHEYICFILRFTKKCTLVYSPTSTPEFTPVAWGSLFGQVGVSRPERCELVNFGYPRSDLGTVEVKRCIFSPENTWNGCSNASVHLLHRYTGSPWICTPGCAVLWLFDKTYGAHNNGCARCAGVF